MLRLVGEASPLYASKARWMDIAEKGTRAGVGTVLLLGRLLGRRAVRVFLAAVALYYALFHPGVRRASSAYLSRALGRPASLGAVFRHVRTFAEVTYDRVALQRGRLDGLELVSHGGYERLRAQQGTGRGALLLGAHLGSFEAMRARSAALELPVSFLVYERHAQRINAALGGLSPFVARRIIQLDPASPLALLALEDRISAGEFVAVLGDRPGLNGKEAAVEFLGARALFPTGPYLLAALLRCPVYFTLGIYTPPGRYDLLCEPLFDRIELPRGRREEVLWACAQRYAARLEAACRLAPYNWFNFHDVWAAPPTGRGEP